MMRPHRSATMTGVITLSLLLVLGHGEPVLAQNDATFSDSLNDDEGSLQFRDDSGYIEDHLPIGDRLITDTKYILTAPQRMTWKSYLALGAILGTAGVMYSQKEEIRDSLQSHRNDRTDNLSENFKPLGNQFFAPSVASAFLLQGLVFKDAKNKETGVMLFESIAFTALATGLGQFIFAEDRPDKGGEMNFFSTHGHGVSGHAALASSLAGPLNRQYLQVRESDSPFHRFLKYTGNVIVYGAPLMTGWSRLNDDDHYSWNVLLGLAIGYTMGELVANSHEVSKKRNWEITPYVTSEEGGVRLSYVF